MFAADAATRIQLNWLRRMRAKRTIYWRREGMFYSARESELTAEQRAVLASLSLHYNERRGTYSILASRGSTVSDAIREAGFSTRFVLTICRNRFVGVSCQRLLKPIIFRYRQQILRE